MTKKIALFMICLLGLMVFAGCGQKEEATPAPETVVEEEATAPEEAADISLADLLAKGKSIEGLSYDLTMSSNGATTMTGHFWVQGKNMKMDVEVGGQRAVNIINVDEGKAFVYMPDQKLAMKMPMESMDANGSQTPLEMMDQVDPAEYMMGEAVDLNGMPCRIVTNSQAGVENKMWISEEYGIPMKVEITADGQTTTMEYSNLQVGPIPAETFQLPEGTEMIG